MHGPPTQTWTPGGWPGEATEPGLCAGSGKAASARPEPCGQLPANGAGRGPVTGRAVPGGVSAGCPWQFLLCCESPHSHPIGVSKHGICNTHCTLCSHTHALTGAGAAVCNAHPCSWVCAGVSPKPVMGTRGSSQQQVPRWQPPPGKQRDPSEGCRAHGHATAVPNPPSCPFSPPLTLDKGNLQPNCKLECKIKNKDPSPR